MLIEPNPLVEEVIGCAIDVHRALGPGLLESAYASCLCEELDQRRIPFRREVPVPVRYKNRSIECAYRADFVVKDTVVVEVKSMNGKAWLDRAGDFTTDNVVVNERFTMTDADHINYEATITDNKVFSRPWKISMPLYRWVEKNAQLLEFKCVEFSEELLYGHLRKRYN